MTTAQDASTVVELEVRERELNEVLGELRRLRWTLVPAAVDRWRGSARRAYDAEIDALGVSADRALSGVERSLIETERARARAHEEHALATGSGGVG
jgi:hypothetical protein